MNSTRYDKNVYRTSVTVAEELMEELQKTCSYVLLKRQAVEDFKRVGISCSYEDVIVMRMSDDAKHNIVKFELQWCPSKSSFDGFVFGTEKDETGRMRIEVHKLKQVNGSLVQVCFHWVGNDKSTGIAVFEHDSEDFAGDSRLALTAARKAVQ